MDLWKNIRTIYKIFGAHTKGYNLESNGCARIIKLIFEPHGTIQGILCESLLWHRLIPSVLINNENDIISGYFHVFFMTINHSNYAQNPLTQQIKQTDEILEHSARFIDEHLSITEFIKAMNDLMITSISQKSMLDIIYSILCLNQINFIATDPASHTAQNLNMTIDKASLPFIKCACLLLHIDSKELLEYLMTVTITAHNKSFKRYTCIHFVNDLC